MSTFGREVDFGAFQRVMVEEHQRHPYGGDDWVR